MYNEKENDESSTDEEQFEFDENQVGSSTNSQVMEDDSSPLSLLSRGKGNSFIASSSNFYKTAEVSTIAKKAAKKLSKTYSKEELRRELSFNFDVPDKRQKVDDDNQLCDNSNTRVLSSFSAPNTPLSSPPSSPFSSPPSSPLSSPTSSPIFSFNRPRIMRSLSSMEESVQTSFLHSKNSKLLSRSQQSLMFFSEKQSSSLEEHKQLQNEENNASSSSSSSLSSPCSVSMPSLPLIPSIDRCQRISVSTLNSLLLQSRFPDDVIQSKTFLSSPLLSNPKHLISKHLIHLRDDDDNEDDAVNNNNIHDDDDDDDAVINNKEKNTIKDKSFIKKFKSYLIIDARYDYEYEGGHIQGAIHCPPNQIESFVHSLFPHFMDENIAIIFHCEFSSQRAPRAYSALRNLDRWLNVHLYPRVSFPDVYVLHGGYRDFFHAYPAFCSPASYVEMKDKRFKHLLREYSAEKRSLKRTRFHSFCQ